MSRRLGSAGRASQQSPVRRWEAGRALGAQLACGPRPGRVTQFPRLHTPPRPSRGPAHPVPPVVLGTFVVPARVFPVTRLSRLLPVPRSPQLGPPPLPSETSPCALCSTAGTARDSPSARSPRCACSAGYLPRLPHTATLYGTLRGPADCSPHQQTAQSLKGTWPTSHSQLVCW